MVSTLFLKKTMENWSSRGLYWIKLLHDGVPLGTYKSWGRQLSNGFKKNPMVIVIPYHYSILSSEWNIRYSGRQDHTFHRGLHCNGLSILLEGSLLEFLRLW